MIDVRVKRISVITFKEQFTPNLELLPDCILDTKKHQKEISFFCQQIQKIHIFCVC